MKHTAAQQVPKTTYGMMIFILCGMLLVSYLSPYPLKQSDSIQTSNRLWTGTDILVQYSATGAKTDSEAIFASYCHLHGCQHIVVAGDCGREEEICAQMIHLAVALQSHGRTVFVSHDVIPKDLEHDAFDQLCGEKPFSIGSNIQCINQAAMTPSSAVWFSTLDTVARCHKSNSMHVFDKIYNEMRKDQLNVHLIDSLKFGSSDSTEWKIRRSDQMKLRQETAIGRTSRLELRYGTYEIQTAVDIRWENGVAIQQSRKSESYHWSLMKEKPSKHRIEQAAVYLDKTSLLPECELADDEIDSFATPRISTFEHFSTAAVQEEVRKHDRLVVHATSYMRRMKEKDRVKWKVTAEQAAKQQVFIGIYVSNRDVPYINPLIMSFLEGNTPDELNSMFQIHLFNCERRGDELDFPLWRNTLAKLPLFHLHNFSANSSLTRHNFKDQLYADTGRAMELCIESKLPWCLLLEEDAAAPTNFAKVFDQFVLQALKGQENDISVVSLYSFYNLAKGGPHRISDKEYATNGYLRDRAKTNAERMDLGMDAYAPSYEIKKHKYQSGGVALLYSRASAMKLLDYFRSIGPVPKYDVDLYMNFHNFFPKFAKKKRRQIFPSMFNHIGFYSSHIATLKDGNFLTQLNTDARWMFDAGEYRKKEEKDRKN